MPPSPKATSSQTRKNKGAALHYFRIHVSPKPGSRNSARGGAYISCWVNFPHGEGALVLAKYYIRGFGWRVRRVQEHLYPTRADYADSPNRKYFDEAAADGSSFVVHTYPVGGSRSSKSLERTRDR